MSRVGCRLSASFRSLSIPKRAPSYRRALSTTNSLARPPTYKDPPKGNDPQIPGREPPAPPLQEAEDLKQDTAPATFLGTTKRLPEFNLADKVVLVSGAARGLGLVQAEALLEAGATVYALDRLPEPSSDFYRVQKRAAEELGTTFYYRQIDVRDVDNLNGIVETIGEKHGRLDGLIAAAGIQQETPALDYTAKDANMMFEVNITGVFMTAQAVAKQMIKYENGGSIAMIASMSAHVANRVGFRLRFIVNGISDRNCPGTYLPSVQCFKSWRRAIGEKSGLRMGPVWHPREYHFSGLHCHCNG